MSRYIKIDGPEKQKAFLEERAKQQSPCPGCGQMSSLFEACVEDQLDVGDWSNKNHFKCPGCKADLKYTLPWPAGDWYWRRC